MIALVIALAIAVIFHIVNVKKCNEVYQRTNGKIRSTQDLQLIKEAINLSMMLAVFYIVLFVLFVIYLATLFFGGSPGRAVLMLFLFGVITLPIGLYGKKFEKRLKAMEIESDDPQFSETYQRYLKQWKEPRFRLPD